MNMPPPLPGPAPRPPAPADGALRFVTGLAWFSLVLAGLSLAYGLLQVLMSALLPADVYVRVLYDPLGTGHAQLPPLMRWMVDHNLAIGVFGTLSSALLLWLSVGLLRRREWARVAFIGYLIVASVMTVGLIWLMPAMIDASMAMQAGMLPPGQPAPPVLPGLKTVMTFFSAAMVLVFAGLHGWIIWKLCTAPVRVQFKAPVAQDTSS